MGRRDSIARVLLALAVAVVLGASLAPSADASKGGKNTVASVSKRVQAQKDMCEIVGGGTLKVVKRPGGTTTTCNGGVQDGRVCTYTSKKSRCHQTRQAVPGNPNSAPVVPVITGGGPGPEAPADPSDGGEEEPTEDPGGPIILFE